LRRRDKFPPGAAPDGGPRAVATQAVGEEKTARGLVWYMATVCFARNLARFLSLSLAHLPGGVAWEAGVVWAAAISLRDGPPAAIRRLPQIPEQHAHCNPAISLPPFYTLGLSHEVALL